MNSPYIVIDTNVIISAYLLNSKTVLLALQKARDEYRVLASEETFEEVVRNFSKPKFSKYTKYHDIKADLEEIADLSYFIAVTTRVHECRHEKDNKFLELAISGGAKIILSGDNDLLSMHPWRGVAIVTPLGFLNML